MRDFCGMYRSLVAYHLQSPAKETRARHRTCSIFILFFSFLHRAWESRGVHKPLTRGATERKTEPSSLRRKHKERGLPNMYRHPGVAGKEAVREDHRKKDFP